MTKALQIRGADGRASGSGIATGAGRSSDYGRAHRHTRRVKLLRRIVPLVCIAFAGIYVFSVLQASGIGAKLARLPLPRINPENLTMENPSYDGFGKDGSSYVLNAKTAQQDFANPDEIKLNGITADLFQPDKTKTHMVATRGTFNNKSSLLELYESIDVVSESGLKAQLTQATVHTKDSLLTSREPVAVQFPAGTINSLEMTLKQKTREVVFLGDVRAHLIPEKADKDGEKPTDPAAPAAAAPPADPAKAGALPVASNEPIDITSHRLDIDDAKRTAIFRGEVRSVQKDQWMTTPEMTVLYENADSGDGSAGAKLPTPGAAGSGKVSRIVAMAPVEMQRGPDQHVTTDSLDYDAKNETAVLIGNVVMTSGTDRQATADRADLDQRADTVLLTGTVVVIQGQNELKGRRLLVNRAAGKAELTSPQSEGGNGRITAHLVRSAEGDATKGTSWAAMTDKGSTPPPGAALTDATFKTDPKAPVDVESDRLDVDDGKKTATFRGDVKAVQGDFVITTPEMVATYSGEARLADVGAPAPTDGTKDPKADGAEKKPGTELTRIQALRKVVVTSKVGQTVNGDWADFDAKNNIVVVGGNVVMLQADNIIHGSRLTIDMNTGESTIVTTPAKTVAVPGGGGWTTEASGLIEPTTGGRPSAVFFPNALRSESQKGKSGGSGSWEASTTAGAPAAPGSPAAPGTASAKPAAAAASDDDDDDLEE